MLKKFWKSINGNAAISAAMLAFPLAAAGGTAFDYAYMSSLTSNLQSAADGAALSTAKELGLSKAPNETLQSVAKNYAFSNIGSTATDTNTSVITETSGDNGSLTVSISHVWKPFFLHYMMEDALPLKVSATARLAGKGSICMLGLDETMANSIHLINSARLDATGCGVYSNSSHHAAVSVENNATLISGVTCSSGGFVEAKPDSYQPTPITDCPRIPDPLASRPQPAIGACDHTSFQVNSGYHVLFPGTYCKGIKIKGSAEVLFKPGVYVITDNKFEVTHQATITGENVGFFLAGDKSKLSFKKETTIDLTAPKTGIMAGLLFYEDPAAFSNTLKHEITSDNARTLLGTIYLPKGTLRIDADGPIADQSAYTAIIARAIELDEGPTLHLNSNYDATDVPVPEGLVNDRVYLSN